MSTSVCQNTGLRKADERRPKTNLTYQKHQANVENIFYAYISRFFNFSSDNKLRIGKLRARFRLKQCR